DRQFFFGGERFKMFKDIVKEHGQSDHELFLCWEEAKVTSSHENSVTTNQNIHVNMDGALARDLRSGVPPMKIDPSGRTAQPASRCEDPGPTGKGKGKGKTKNDGGLKGDGKTKKPPNYSAKAHGKVKLGRSTLTDAKSETLASGYISQIRLYQAPMEAATEALDWRLVEGAKDEAALLPLVQTLEKAVESYTNAVRPIKALFAA
ncbi:F5, partial [Symbiodinium necroappetens]